MEGTAQCFVSAITEDILKGSIAVYCFIFVLSPAEGASVKSVGSHSVTPSSAAVYSSQAR